MRLDFLEYFDTLSWNEENNATSIQVLNDFKTIIEGSLLDWDKKDPILSNVIEDIFLLPIKSKDRILSAPDTFNKLTTAIKSKNKLSFTKYLKISIAVEKEILGYKNSFALNKWSALGDYFISENSNLYNKYKAPLLCGKLPIDCRSKFALRLMTNEDFRPVKYGFPDNFLDNELDYITIKLNRSMDRIKATSNSAFNFILHHSNSIVLRKNLNHTRFVSSSCNGFIGQIVLLNPQLDYIDEAILAESLLHETIHSFLLKSEIITPILNIESPLPIVKSPWSGLDLHYHSLIGACFVWYGLLCFWIHAEKNNTFDSIRIQSLLNRSIRGFVDKKFLKDVDLYKKYLSPNVHYQLHKIADHANKMILAYL